MPPTAVASANEVTFPTACSRSSGKTSGNVPVFESTGCAHDSRRIGADRREAELAERDDARVPDEDVQRHDDGDGDERRLEVDDVGARAERAEDADGDDDRGRAEQLDRVRGQPHTRSTVVAPLGANRPAGRTSRTTMTSVKSTDGRYAVWSVGSAP